MFTVLSNKDYTRSTGFGIQSLWVALQRLAAILVGGPKVKAKAKHFLAYSNFEDSQHS
jgi:hypothetical protein